LINAASDRVEAYLGRELYWEEDIEESHVGYGVRTMILDRTPLSAVSSITYDGTTVSSDNYEVHDTDASIVFAPGNWTWTCGLVGGLTDDPWVGTERKLFTVTYDAGWVTPKQYTDDNTLTRSLPYDIEDAVIQMVASRYLRRGKGTGIKSEKLLSWSADYADADTASGMSAEVKAILNRYKRINFA
jgi:hypothetical protein